MFKNTKFLIDRLHWPNHTGNNLFKLQISRKCHVENVFYIKNNINILLCSHFCVINCTLPHLITWMQAWNNCFLEIWIRRFSVIAHVVDCFHLSVKYLWHTHILLLRCIKMLCFFILIGSLYLFCNDGLYMFLLARWTNLCKNDGAYMYLGSLLFFIFVNVRRNNLIILINGVDCNWNVYSQCWAIGLVYVYINCTVNLKHIHAHILFYSCDWQLQYLIIHYSTLVSCTKVFYVIYIYLFQTQKHNL